MQQHHRGRCSCATGLILLTLTTSACSSDEPRPTTTPDRSSSSATLKTMANRVAGDHITLTARLVRVVNSQTFVVNDVDLPEQGLLVLGPLPAHAQPPALLTVSGVIAVYRPDSPQPDSGLERFLDRKIVVADAVRSWA